MRKGSVRIPKYQRHGTGQAKVRLGGHDCYLGKFGTSESRERYRRLISEWTALGCPRPWSGPAPKGIGRGDAPAVNEVILAYLRYATGYYRKDGRSTSEIPALRSALRSVHELYGHVPSTEFGPLALKACRAAMIADRLARTTINSFVGRIKRMFRWAGENELVAASVYEALRTVPGLRRDRSEAVETQAVGPVSSEDVHAVLPHVSAQVRAMIELQLLTGMRPGEVCVMRVCDLRMDDPVWIYRLVSR